MANSHLQDEVKEYVASKVAVYKQLAHVEFVESVPKSAAGAATSTLFWTVTPILYMFLSSLPTHIRHVAFST